MKRLRRIILATVLLALAPVSHALGAPLELLSRAEAALPASRSLGFAADLRADGPAIAAPDLEVPEGKSFTLRLDFVPRDGVTVDITTLKLECLKSAPVDLTARVLPYADKEGVKIEEVSLPPGSYRFRVGIGDLKGKFSEKEFTVKVSVIY